MHIANPFTLPIKEWLGWRLQRIHLYTGLGWITASRTIELVVKHAPQLPQLSLKTYWSLSHHLHGHSNTPHPYHYRLLAEWLLSVQKRQLLLASRNHLIIQHYNGNTRELLKLTVGTLVAVQNQGNKRPQKWDRTGTIIEALPHRQPVPSMYEWICTDNYVKQTFP